MRHHKTNHALLQNKRFKNDIVTIFDSRQDPTSLFKGL